MFCLEYLFYILYSPFILPLDLWNYLNPKNRVSEQWYYSMIFIGTIFYLFLLIVIVIFLIWLLIRACRTKTTDCEMKSDEGYEL
jgi:uncharacterized membrane protein